MKENEEKLYKILGDSRKVLELVEEKYGKIRRRPFDGTIGNPCSEVPMIEEDPQTPKFVDNPMEVL